MQQNRSGSLTPTDRATRVATALGVQSVFEVHGIWAPGVRLMRNLSFAYKALIICVIFLLAVIVPGYLLISTQLESMAFTNKERSGVATLKQFTPFLHGLLKTRNATRAALGKFDSANKYAAARTQTDAALADFEKLLVATADPLSIRPDFDKLKSAWATTALSKNGADAQGRTVFGGVTTATVSLMERIGDQSNLVLDPELDSFYLVSSLLFAMPQISENLGQLWGWGTYVLAHPGMSIDEEKKYLLWAAQLDSSIKQARSFMQRAVVANPSLKSSTLTRK
jgi:hypothetical protein